MIEALRIGLNACGCSAVGILLQESRRNRQGSGFDVHTTCGCLDRKLGED